MSLFGQPAQGQQSGGLFGSSQQTGSAFGAPQQQAPQTSSLFGNMGGQQQQPQQQSGGLFGNLGSNTQQPQQSGGLFGNMGASTQQQNPGQQTSSLFGAPQQQAPQTSSLFGNMGGQQQQQQPQPQQQSGGLFGNLGASTQQQNTAQAPQTSSLFGNMGGQQQAQQSGFGNSQQQQPMGNSLFGNSQRQQSNSSWPPSNSPVIREKSIPDQMSTVLGKWHTGSPDCAFQHYFYNMVGENAAPHYKPNPNEDPKAWEDALGKKPGPGYIPVLCTGFEQLGARINLQANAISGYNQHLHNINDALSVLLQKHETNHSIRALDAKRKHAVLRQRCLRIATKVQVLRNRGYALGGDEEDLKAKLQELEKKAHDPALGARAEEIWARMLTVQERAKVLKNEIEKSGGDAPTMLDEETTKKAQKILEDYDRQLIHLKKELDTIQKEYVEWDSTQRADADARSASSLRQNLR